MKKTIPTLIVLLLISWYSYGQRSVDQEFTGKCAVKEVTIAKGLNSEVQNMMMVMKNGFTDSQFIFGSDGKFKIQLKENAPSMMKEMTSFLNGRNWVYDRDKKELEVGNNELLMFVEQKDGKYYFEFSDTPITLEMDKS